MTEKLLVWKNLHYEKINENPKIKSRYAKIINNFSGQARSGRLTALMGSSGSGKTNLLDLLIGKIPSSSKTYGTITYDGNERELKSWIKTTTFLEQDDIFDPKLSVYTTMTYTVKFLFPRIGNKEKNEMIEKCLKAAEIFEKKDALLESLSGGERKRALVANKLLGNPIVMIFDEPTTGLDSHNAFATVKNLKLFAEKENMIVIVTIHQPGPGLLHVFDDLIYMTNDGVFYEGPVEKLVDFLNENGIFMPERLSESEFLFELFAENPYPYEIKDLRPKADEIIRKKKESDSINLGTVKLQNKNNTYVDINGLNLYHIFYLIKRRIFEVFKSYFVYIGLALLLLIGIGLKNIILDINNPEIQKILKKINIETFSNNISNVNRLYISINQVIYNFQFIFFLKFTIDKSICYQEVFSGKYSVFTYFCAQIIFELFFLNFTSFIFLFETYQAISKVSDKFLLFSIHSFHIFCIYIIYLSLASISYKETYTTVIFMFLLQFLTLKNFFLSMIYQNLKKTSLLRILFKGYNLNPYTISQIVFNYICLLINSKGFTLDDKKKFVETYSFLGHSFPPSVVGIYFCFLILGFLVLSFNLLKRKITLNARLKLNE